jgi:heme oxygenase
MAHELLSDQLKIRTLISHQQLEKMLLQRLRGMYTVNDYLHLIQNFYCYFAALEERIKLYVGTSELPDYQERRKSASLENDVLSLGGVLPEKVPALLLPMIENQLQAFGALYVMEGSTLGGLIISQMIKKQLNISDNHLSFFRSYGDQLVPMWNSFKLILDKQPETKAEDEIVIAAADATFGQFKIFLESKNRIKRSVS